MMSESGETRLRMLRETKAALSRCWAFVSRHLSVSEAHTVEFYSGSLWRSYLGDAEPRAVQQRLLKRRCSRRDLGRDVGGVQGIGGSSSPKMDVEQFLQEAEAHTLPGLGVCVSTDEAFTMFSADKSIDVPVRPEDFMSTKKSHEVELMSRMVVMLALECNVSQVIDLGSGKGYLGSYLSMRCGLKVFGIDSSAINTRGAAERNRKLGKFRKGYKKQALKPEEEPFACSPERGDQPNTGTLQTHGAVIKLDGASECSSPSAIEVSTCKQETCGNEETVSECKATSCGDCWQGEQNCSSLESSQCQWAGKVVEPEEAFVALSELNDTLNNEENVAFSIGTDVVSSERDLLLKELPEIHEVQALRPKGLSVEERARRKRVNLKAKLSTESTGANEQTLLTCRITPDTEIGNLVTDMEAGLLVGLHTCGDLAATTLRLFAGRAALRGVCGVGCCYHLLTEPPRLHDSTADDGSQAYGFPMSEHLKALHCTIGRNARMSACLAPERVTSGKGLLTESLFYRAVLQVIIEDHYGSIRSTKRVGKTYAKSASFLDYTRKALRRLELDESKLSDAEIQDYYNKFLPRFPEMEAFNMLKVILAPCIEGIILMDRLCFLLEQACVSQAALVQMFHPLTSPRCYALIATRR